LAETNARAKATIQAKESQAYEQRQRIEANTETAVVRTNADARHIVAQSKSKALIKES